MSWASLQSLFSKIDFSALAQIAILYAVIYAILKRARGSRFGQALMGVGILLALLAIFTFVLQFDVIAKLLQLILIYLALSTVVIFQPEIRRALSAVGALGFFERPRHAADGAVNPEYLLATVLDLSERRMGALIAIERGISLRSYEASGVPLNALFTRELAISIFTPPLPLHDGGMTLRNGRISSAHCVFPVSNNPDLITNGMRHRAAVGLSEDTDALVLVVSEESGTISVARNGHLYRCIGEGRVRELRRWIEKALQHGQNRRGLAARAGGYVQRLVARLGAKGAKAS